MASGASQCKFTFSETAACLTCSHIHVLIGVPPTLLGVFAFRLKVNLDVVHETIVTRLLLVLKKLHIHLGLVQSHFLWTHLVEICNIVVDVRTSITSSCCSCCSYSPTCSFPLCNRCSRLRFSVV